MQPEVADVLRKVGSKIENYGLNTWQLRTLYAIKKCRTAELGGHIDACDDCGNITISYNSCRNRHCPKCQGNKLEKQNSCLFPIFMWFLLCPIVLTHWQYTSPKWCMIYSLKRLGQRSKPLVKTRDYKAE